MRTNQSETGAGTCLYKPAPPCSQNSLSLSSEDQRLHFLTELKHQRCLPGAEQSRTSAVESRPAQSSADQQEAEQRSTALSCLARERTGPSTASQPCYIIIELFHGHVVFTGLLWHSSAVFALNKVFIFTTPQICDSCWHLIGANNLVDARKVQGRPR